MTSATAEIPRTRGRRSTWWWLKMAAVIGLIVGNMLYFGGQAALDLWQALGPATTFQGTIVDHQHIVTQGEESDEHNVLVIESNHGRMSLDVSARAFDNTDVGQHVAGELDRWGFFGHEQGLRSLKVDGHVVQDPNTELRVAGQLLILIVVAGVGGLALRLILRHILRAPGDNPA